MTPAEHQGMTSREVLWIVTSIQAQGVCYQINGGWAVDALVGHQTRVHRDLDLFVAADAVPALLSWLRGQGYAEETDCLPARVELRREQFRVDVHPMSLDAEGNGAQFGRDGDVIYVHPKAARTTGRIDGQSVCVATAARLLELHEGYVPREQDRHDLRLLRELLGS